MGTLVIVVVGVAFAAFAALVFSVLTIILGKMSQEFEYLGPDDWTFLDFYLRYLVIAAVYTFVSLFLMLAAWASQPWSRPTSMYSRLAGSRPSSWYGWRHHRRGAVLPSDISILTPFGRRASDREMNYFSHALPFLDDPYFVAGTAVPDWLAVVDRGVRVRAKNVEPLAAHPNRETAAVARGLLQHFRDDAQFHRTRAFAETTLELSAAIRRVLAADSGFRPSFLGHVLVEVLLDWTLAEDHPGGLDAYYRALESVDPRGRPGGGQPHVGPRHRPPGPHDFPLLPGADLVGLRPR